jgi:formate dehydrogenase subunit gamma
MRRGLIQATDAFERIVHWSLALSCLALCITGMGMMFHSLNFIGELMGGLKSLKYVHNFTGLWFCYHFISPYGCGGRRPGFFRCRRTGVDQCAGGYVWHVDKVLRLGSTILVRRCSFWRWRLWGDNGDIRSHHVVSVVFSSGFCAAHVHLHALGFVVIFAFFFVHLYLGTVGSRVVPAMLTGCDACMVEEQHPSAP